jgi:hypothetical protein
MLTTFKLRYRKKSSPRGYIALLSVIVLGVIGVSVMLSIILAGISASKTNIALEQGSEARTMASSCTEEALQKVLETATTSAKGSLSIGSSTCSYTITSQNGQNITINASGTMGTLTSKVIAIIATTTPSIILSSWQEVGDF